MLAAGACEGVRRRGGGLPRARERAQGRQPKGLRESEGGRACGACETWIVATVFLS